MAARWSETQDRRGSRPSSERVLGRSPPCFEAVSTRSAAAGARGRARSRLTTRERQPRARSQRGRSSVARLRAITTKAARGAASIAESERGRQSRGSGARSRWRRAPAPGGAAGGRRACPWSDRAGLSAGGAPRLRRRGGQGVERNGGAEVERGRRPVEQMALAGFAAGQQRVGGAIPPHRSQGGEVRPEQLAQGAAFAEPAPGKYARSPAGPGAR